MFKDALLNDRDEMLPYFFFMAKTGVIGIKTYEKITSVFESPREFFEVDTGSLEKLGIFQPAALKKVETEKRKNDFWKDYSEMLNLGIKMIPIEDEAYPMKLRNIKNPPVVLFSKGKLKVPEVSVAVIGARECTQYGENIAYRLGELLAERHICLVSGMARGIDSVSQTGCMNKKGYSIAVLGGGVDVIYPRESLSLYRNLCDNGCVISEFPPGTKPQRAFFALRNRIISGLSDVVCVVEASEKSGTMITVDCALEQGREVYAVPGRITDITSTGTNELIKQGSGIITDLNGFAAELSERFFGSESICTEDSFEPFDKLNLFYTKMEQCLIKRLTDDSFTLDEMSMKLGIASFEILGICVSLVSKGILESVGAARFKATFEGIGIKNRLLKRDLSGNL